MARSLSLDDLIIFCLGEIALSGAHGIQPTDLARIVNAFYDATDRLSGDATAQSPASDAAPRRRPAVDHSFLEYVWKWLTRHDDVFVGPNKEGNNLSLSEIEARNAKYDSTRKGKPKGKGKANDKATADIDASDGENSRNSSTVPDDAVPPVNGYQQPLRMYVTEERMWLAICGHGPDNGKIFATEFTLLSLIASRRSKGILQGDLVKLSGQDKRSVPARTDNLKAKGYIDKRPVLAKGSRTSLLTLRRFVKGDGVSSAISKADGSHIVDQEKIVRHFLDIVRSAGLVTRSDLKKALDLTNRVQWKLLGRIIRRFEDWDCVRRVNASSTHTQTANLKWKYPCVKYLREPTEEEIGRFVNWGRSGRPDDDDDGLNLDAEGDEDDEAMPTLGAPEIPLEGALQEVGRTVPIFNPDRFFPNMVNEAIGSAGTDGMTLMSLKNVIAGPLYSRPVDFYMGRLVENWTKSQPPHLRHMSIIRDTAIDHKTAYFLHYTFDNFEKLVENGGAFWEGVVTKGKGHAKPEETIKAILTKPELDEFGFPVTMRPVGQFRDGKATMAEMMRSIDPGRWILSGLDPIVVEVDGQDEIRYLGTRTLQDYAAPGDEEGTPGPRSRRSSTSSTMPKKGSRQPKQTKQESGVGRAYKMRFKPTGRPRKYEHGMEKFWRIMGQKLLKSRGLEGKGAGVMRHILVTEMIRTRPEEFDVTYLRAEETGAPVPTQPSDITQDWVDRTKLFMQRDNPGIYVAPKVATSKEGSINESYKLLVVIKSERLQECCFSDMRTVHARSTPKVQFFTSSRAHTLHIPQTIPFSKFNESIGWLIPTSSGAIPKPPVPLKWTPAPVQYLPSTAAHTIPWLRSKLKGAPRKYGPSTAGRSIDKPARSVTRKAPIVNRNNSTLPSGPVLGVFKVKYPAATTNGDVSVPTTPRSSMPPPTHRADGTPTPPRKRGRPRKDDLRAQGLDTSLIETSPPSRRTLRATITPPTKRRENVSDQAGEESSMLESSAYGDSARQGSPTYLNSPTPGASPRAFRLPPRAKLVRQPSLLATAIAAKSSDDVYTELPAEPSEKSTLAIEENDMQTAQPSTTPGDAEATVTADSAPNEHKAASPQPMTVDAIDGVNSEAVDADPVASIEDDEDESADSDATVDLGPAKYIHPSRRRNVEALAQPSTPKKTKKAPKPREFPAAEETTSSSQQLELDQTGDAATKPTAIADSVDPVDSAKGDAQPHENGKPEKEQAENVQTPQATPSRKTGRRGSGTPTSLKPAAKELPKVQLNREASTFQPRKKRRRLDVWDGSIGFMRRKIITDIIDKCHGLVPFGYPLWYAFATAWRKSQRNIKPDYRTLKAAVKALVDSGQIKQLKFSFKDKNGLMSTQAMLARPAVKVSDDIVREVQKKIIDAHPKPYAPPEFEIETDLRLHDTPVQSGIYTKKPINVDEIVSTKHEPPVVKQREERRIRLTEFRERIRTNALPEPIVPKEPRVKRLERFGGTHKLVKTKVLPPPKITLPETESITFQAAAGFSLPETQPLQFGTAAEGARSVSPDTESEAVAARELLNDRKRKLLPHSLADVPDRRRKKVDHSQVDDPDYSRFCWELEKVEKWEAKKEALFDDEAPSVWQFINHNLPGSHSDVLLEGPLLFDAWSWFDEAGEEQIESVPPSPGRQGQRLPNQQARLLGRGLRKRRLRHSFEEESPQLRTNTPKKKRKVFGKLQTIQPIKFDPNILFPDQSKVIPRGPQVWRTLSEETIQKIFMTFAVVRVLAGGVEKNVDFSLVNQVFPDETEQWLKDRWRTARNRYRRVVRKYMEEFQELYLKAYESGDIPSFDYDDLSGNDWSGIVEWAITNIRKPIKRETDELPDAREDFDSQHNINVQTGTRPLREIYAYNTTITVPMREQAMCAVPFAIPLGHTNDENIDPSSDNHQTSASRSSKSSETAIAKSWALATILTPEDQFSGSTANKKISNLPNYNTLLDSSVKSLLSSRVIVNATSNKKARVSSRAYDISDNFLSIFSKKKNINETLLTRAMWYKTHVLDPAFSNTEGPKKILFDTNGADDGDMIAILNLLANNRIIVRPSTSQEKGERVPANRYGLMDDYQTRFMDRDALRFGVEIELAKSTPWVAGNPLLQKAMMLEKDNDRDSEAPSSSLLTLFPPPRGAMDLPPSPPSSTTTTTTLTSSQLTPGRIPLYFSIHAQFLPKIFSMLTSAVVGIIAQRPGISTEEVTDMLAPVVDGEDVGLVLEWARDVGAVKSTGGDEGRWETGEWWWCICDGELSEPGQSGEVGR